VRKIAVSTLVLVVLVGWAPLLWLLWWGRTGAVEPLSIPVTVRKGQFTSPPFAPAIPDKDEQYQIELYFLPSHAPLDLDWKVVTDRGAVLAHGEYREGNALGNDAILGYYRPVSRSVERVILDVHDENTFDTTLHVGLPERTLDASYGFPLAEGWALFVTVVGIGILGLAYRYHKC
jgi:hypothetical protein